MLALALLLPMLAVASNTAEAPVVATAAGRVQGAWQGHVAVFKGIPFAAPPVGELRWKAPQTVAPWQGVRDGSQSGRACIQPADDAIELGGSVGPTGEDCLYLNVWTAAPGAQGKRPVMVWIHGGGLVFGAGHQSVYDGASMARRGAVMVTFNYRMGPLGFFSHPSINGGARDPINFGLLDQIAALRWVRDNIAAFGGDPSNVTIMGQSAGAQSVLALYASPLARGLFHKGIAQSPYGIPSHTRAKASEVGIGIAKALGVPQGDAAALRAVPAERFIQIKDKTLSLAPSFIVGDEAMPTTILDAFQAERQAKLPLIIGNTSDDGSVAAAFGLDPATIIQRLGAARIVVKALYPKLPDDLLGRYTVRDLVFSAYARRIAVLHGTAVPTWRYYFSYLPSASRQLPGVPHGADVAYALDTLGHCQCTGATPTGADLAVARTVGDYWYEFARTGAPSSRGAPKWIRDSRKEGRTMEFSATPVLRTNLMKSRLNLMITGLKVLAAYAQPSTKYTAGGRPTRHSVTLPVASVSKIRRAALPSSGVTTR